MSHEAHHRLTPSDTAQPPSSLRTPTGHIQPTQRPKDKLWGAVVLASGEVRSKFPQPL